MLPPLDLSLVPIAVVAGAALVGALVTGALGYGFSTVTVPLALLYFPNRTLAPALVLVELVTNAVGLVAHRASVPAVARRTLPMLVGILPGVAFGALALSSVSARSAKLATYALLLPLVIAQGAGLRWPLRRERLAAVPAGAAIGALYGVTTVSGPPIALFLGNQGLVLAEFRAAMYLVRVTESVAAALVFWGFGFFTPAAASLAWTLVPSVVVGVPVGALVLRRLEAESFRRVCTSANTGFISLGLAQSTVQMELLAPAVAYGLLAVACAVEGVRLVRYFARRGPGSAGTNGAK